MGITSGIRRFSNQARIDGFGPTVRRKTRILCNRPVQALRNKADAAHDIRICGMSLERNFTAINDGAVDTIHAPYGSLEVMLGSETFTADDVLLDVGCGMGRPLAYLAGRKFPGRLVGIEINEQVAQTAQQWTEKFSNVQIIGGDAFDLDLSPYTVFFMWKPMVPEVFRRFVEKMEAEAVRPIKLFYLADMTDGDFVDARNGWTVLRRDWIYKVHGVPQHWSPQRYSVWEYRPEA